MVHTVYRSTLDKSIQFHCHANSVVSRGKGSPPILAITLEQLLFVIFYYIIKLLKCILKQFKFIYSVYQVCIDIF